MKQVILICAMVVAIAFPMQAQDGKHAGIRAAISSQIDAFRAGDADTAFSFASPNIQQVFRSPDVFGHMVEQGYPMVWASTGLAFLDLHVDDGQTWQKVQLRDGDGRLHVIDYKMIEHEGAWRIDGVMFLRSAGQEV
ncbi:MAG: DUF4864 domain-containing protein [Maritimibacter sp.]